MSGNTILVTGTAGFIGAAVATALLARGDAVIGVDNLNALAIGDVEPVEGEAGIFLQPLQPRLL